MSRGEIQVSINYFLNPLCTVYTGKDSNTLTTFFNDEFELNLYSLKSKPETRLFLKQIIDKIRRERAINILEVLNFRDEIKMRLRLVIKGGRIISPSFERVISNKKFKDIMNVLRNENDVLEHLTWFLLKLYGTILGPQFNIFIPLREME